MTTFKKGDKVRYVGSFRDLEMMWDEEGVEALRHPLTVDLVTEVKDNFQGVVVEEFPEYCGLNNWNLVLIREEIDAVANLVLSRNESRSQENDGGDSSI